MQPDAIFGPVFATAGLTFVVWVLMYVRRIHFIQTRGLRPDDLALPGALASLSPPQVANPSDNLKNLFEIPVLFYALASISSSPTRSTGRTWRRGGRSRGFAGSTAPSTARSTW